MDNSISMAEPVAQVNQTKIQLVHQAKDVLVTAEGFSDADRVGL